MVNSELRELFVEFASFGAGQTMMVEMDGFHFAKMCRETGLIDRDFTLIDVDILFAKVKVRGKRRINFQQFVSALQMMAEKKGVSMRHLQQQLLNSHGPNNNARARVHYDNILDKLTDTSLYTGAHRERFDEYGRGRGLDGRGVRPGSVGMVTDPLAMMCTRGSPSTVDVRGRCGFATGKRRPASAQPKIIGMHGTPDLHSRSAYGSSRGGSRATSPTPSMGSRGGSRATSPRPWGETTRSVSASRVRPTSARPSRQSLDGGVTGGRPKSATRSRVDGRRYQLDMQNATDMSVVSLDGVFVSFCSFGAGGDLVTEMDNVHFAKLCRDCGLLDRHFTTVDVDLIFSKAKTRGARKISFSEFHDCLTMIGKDKGVSKGEIIDVLLNSPGPVIIAAQADRADRGSVLARLTDTRRYTGAHKHRFSEDGRGLGLAGRDLMGPVGSVNDVLGRLCERKGGSGVTAGSSKGVLANSMAV